MINLTNEIITNVNEGIAMWSPSLRVDLIWDNDGKYYINGIFEKKEAICKLFLGKKTAIIQVNIQEAIHSTMHQYAKNEKIIILSNLSMRLICEDLRKRIHYAISDPDLGWKGDEIALVKDFIKRNDWNVD